MENIKQKLLITIKRSHRAYMYYLEDQKYFQAKRIFKANEVVYELPNGYLYEIEDNNHKDLIDFTAAFVGLIILSPVFFVVNLILIIYNNGSALLFKTDQVK